MEPGLPAETPPASGTCRPPPGSAGTLAAAAASRPDVAPPWCGGPRCCCCCCCCCWRRGRRVCRGPPPPPRGPKAARLKRMVRLAAELLLLLGLLLLTLHITVLRGGGEPHAPSAAGNHSQRQNTLTAEDHSPEDSFTLNPEERREYPNLQAAHRPFPKEQFRQESGHTSLQRDGPRSFLLDLPNFPDLSKADINGQNPNIQVTIEVVDSPDTEADKDLQKESSKPSWPAPSPDWRNWWQRSSTLTRMSSGDQDYKYDSTTEDSNFLNPLGGWESHAPSHRAFESKEQPEYDYIDGEGDWSPWSPCSVTCGSGSQKRTRSCGYACTATESRTCDRPNCPGIEDTFRTAATEVSLLAGSEDFNATKLFEVDTDSCERWMSCKSEFLKKYMHKVVNDLPSCPCSYPREVAYSTAEIFDRLKRKNFRWKDASGPKEKLEIYKPTARYCIRSMLSLESTTLAAQHCCYDDNMQLITRGKGAGTPNLISIEFSAELHYKVDILPWIICKGDWSRYNEARPPNNGQKCTENPSDEDYYKQFQEAREY
ncbi:isthmin-1 [Onychostruthus taczanowskii]|uniref:isthmin-1 n=1 Tax=Onychostruthus taczanowskii TaxID=356909 RepID=UPI001B80CFDE|nr:isthmin-1 [Onychostruthus taczanowskii]